MRNMNKNKHKLFEIAYLFSYSAKRGVSVRSTYQTLVRLPVHKEPKEQGRKTIESFSVYNEYEAKRIIQLLSSNFDLDSQLKHNWRFNYVK